MSDHKQNKDVDAFSGVETTGHDWDGIKELNNPMPRWWVWVFIVTVVWSVGYWVIYPAWPTLSGEGFRGGTVGRGNHTQYGELQASQAEILARRAQYLDGFRNASFADVKSDDGLFAFAVAGGAAAFKDNCATCHGSGGSGGPGYPNLNDDDWIWGGTMDDIYTTLKYGIRADHDETRFNDMPAYGDILSGEEIASVAAYVLSLSGKNVEHQEAIDLEAGKTVFMDNCAACHGEMGEGVRELGGPRLNDAIWLYGSSYEQVVQQIAKPKMGVMPFWDGRLSEDTIRQLTVYVHSLGGGEDN